MGLGPIALAETLQDLRQPGLGALELLWIADANVR